MDPPADQPTGLPSRSPAEIKTPGAAPDNVLRKAAERTIHGLWDAIGRILNLYPPHECANYFANAGYDAD